MEAHYWILQLLTQVILRMGGGANMLLTPVFSMSALRDVTFRYIAASFTPD